MITTSGDAAKETSSSKTTDSNPTSGQHGTDSSSKGISFSSNALDSVNSSAISSAVKGMFSSNDIFGGSISKGEHNATNTTTKTPTSDNSTYGNKISVDSVFGTGVNGHASASTSGDYQAYANEKSNVGSQTFNNQPEVTVTPISAMVNKGTVSNNDISSVDGLLMTNKDKESEEVLDSTKRRNQNEEDETADNKMRDYIRGINDKADTSTDEEKAATDEFKLGNDKYDDEAKKEIAAADKEMNLETEKERVKVQALANQVSELTKQKDDIVKSVSMPSSDPNTPSYAPVIGDFSIQHNTDGTATITTEHAGSVTLTKEEVDAAEANGLVHHLAGDGLSGMADAFVDKILSTKKAESDKANIDAVNRTRANVAARMEKVKAIQKKYDDMRTAEEASDTKQGFDKAIQNAAEKGADEKTVQAMTDIATSIDEAQTSMKQAIEKNDIPTYVEAQKQYNKNLNEAMEIGNRLTQTDFNKDFVEEVAKANDFEVTLADGTKTTYSQFATDMVTKSPEVAKAMYEAKAQKYETDKHPILAKIERTKAEMAGTWLGSKLTQADNQVRGQFNQMAKTNMRATYATYNNVLNDPNATPEAKAEASASINQANGLMTASAALQASTGFLSGIGDSMKDGAYGVTDPATLNAYQKTLNAIDNFAKITLGLGATPGANKAYQNMYYMAGAKVDESGLFSSDFDKDGFALCQEYGNNAAAGMIAGAGELATGIALFFNPATAGIGLNLTSDSIQTFLNGLYGVQRDASKAEKYNQEVLSYFKEAESIAAETGNKEALDAISGGITQIEDYKVKASETTDLNSWLEGSGSSTATNDKFNQALTYDEWLKLIESDPALKEYAKQMVK